MKTALETVQWQVLRSSNRKSVTYIGTHLPTKSHETVWSSKHKQHTAQPNLELEFQDPTMIVQYSPPIRRSSAVHQLR
jgi:hypothetical protein